MAAQTHALLTILAAISTVGVAVAESDRQAPLAQLESALVRVIERCERSVVSIARYQAPAQRRTVVRGANGARILLPQGPALPGELGNLQPLTATATPIRGAGVVIDSNENLILTQYRVVEFGQTHVVTDAQGAQYKAEIRAADPRSGLAVLATLGPLAKGGPTTELPRLAALPIGQAEQLRKGRLIVAIGNPFSIESDGQPTASWGSVTNTASKAPALENLNNTPFPRDGTYRTTLHHFGSLIQTDAKLGWNAGGGAVVNLRGELIGVTTTVSAIEGHEQPAGYAIPLNKAMRRAIESMSQGVAPEYGLLGVRFYNNSAARSPQTGRVGIGIREAFPGGPAHRAGLQTGDLIVEIDGQPIRTPDALQLTVSSLAPGAQAPVVFERKAKQREATVELGKAYVDPSRTVVSRRRYPLWRGIRVDFPTAIDPEVLELKVRENALAREGCVAVVEVDQQSVSWRSGVRPYDFISHVSGNAVTTPQQFYAAVRDAKENVKLKFTKPLTGDDAALN